MAMAPVPPMSAVSRSMASRVASMGHRISDKAEAAYRRGDQFEKRRKLMEAWAAFCESRATGKVIAIR